ncbi:MAG TPA: YsnF/AvaK domain-containing protein [Chloroflexota bacterium]|jgi:uncharacterized protein (TIGR02271 family)
MTTTERMTVAGVFHNMEDARDAVEALKDEGFAADDIGLLAHDRERGREVAEETGTRSHAGEGAATGLVAGGILGGLGGWLVGIGALAIPGVGPFIAAGALGAALTGAAVGAGVGAIAGALIGLGIPEEEARYYEGEVRGGRTLVTVRAPGRYDEARDVLRDYGAYDIEDRGTERALGRTAALSGTAMPGAVGRWDVYLPEYRNRWQQRYGATGGRWGDYEPAYRYGWEMRNRPEYREHNFEQVEPELRDFWEPRHREMPWDRARESIRDAWEHTTGSMRTGDTAQADRMQLREEELHAQRTPVETGRVSLGKEVTEEQRTLEVPVRREEVTVERHPVERHPSDRPIEESGRTIEVPVREERVEVEKRPVVYEEVGIAKRQVTETERVSDTVRREEARVDREGDVDVRGWNEAMPRYRQRWQQRYGSTGERWETSEPAYRYGYEMRNRPEYRGRRWADVEPDLNRDWSARHPDSPWDRARESIRETWEETTS